MLLGADISNLQGPPSQYRSQLWYRNATFVIVQAIQPPSPFPGWDHVDAVTGLKGYTGEQITAAREDGKKVGAYAFLWNTLANPYVDIQARLNIVPSGFPLDMRPWVDVEDTAPLAVPKRTAAITNGRQGADDWSAARGLPPSGGYSGTWYVNGYLGGWWPSNWLKWWADYTLPPGALLTAPNVAHQYTSSPVDSDSLLESEILSGGVTLSIVVGPGMQAQMQAASDSPLYGHKFFQESDDQGGLYEVEECWGSKGKYVSSNASGEWVNAGPIG